MLIPVAGVAARRERTRGFSASEELVAGAASEVDACAVSEAEAGVVLAGASDVAAACDVALSVVVAGAVDVAGAVLAGASALVAAAVVATGFVDAGVVSATVLVSTKDAVVSPASATGEIGAAVVSVFSSACAVPPIIISVPSKTEQTPIFNLRREKRLFFSLNKSLPIVFHNNWISHHPIVLSKNLF